MFRFSIKKLALGIVAVAAIGGIVYCCWTPRRITVQVLFNKLEGMQPSRQSFPQNAIYRLKITNLEKVPGVELYPTIEIDQSLSHTSLSGPFSTGGIYC